MLRGVFFDNNQKHIDEVNSQNFVGMLTIKIPETANLKPILVNETPLKEYIRSFEGKNRYANFILKYYKDDKYDPISGVQAEHLADAADHINELLKENSKKNSASKHYLIFDWDRTLSMFEGVFDIVTLMDILEIYLEDDQKAFCEDMLVYLFGGEQRLKMIRDFITEMMTYGITIVILTNNTGCNAASFYIMVRAFHAGIEEKHVLCSKNYDGDKGTTVRKSVLFKNSASTSGGTRRCRRNKKRTRRRASKKRN